MTNLNDVHWNNDIGMWEVCIGDQVVCRTVNLVQAIKTSSMEDSYGTTWPVRVEQAAKRVARKIGKPLTKGRLQSAIYLVKATKYEARGSAFVILGSTNEKYRLEHGQPCLCKDKVDWCKHKVAHEIVLEARNGSET